MGNLADKLKELTKEVAEVEECDDIESDEDTGLPFKVGKAYFIRTVTYFATGRVKAIKGGFLVLKDAAWIADTGRFRQAIETGVLDEVEPVDVDMFVNVNSITDAFVWKHKLPRDQK